jgi:hypothetical protein
VKTGPKPKTGGPKKKPEPPLSDDQRERAAALMREGKTAHEIVAAVGGTPAQLTGLRRELGIAHPTKIRGELERQRVAEYMGAHPSETQQAVAAATGKSINYVKHIAWLQRHPDAAGAV